MRGSGGGDDVVEGCLEPGRAAVGHIEQLHLQARGHAQAGDGRRIEREYDRLLHRGSDLVGAGDDGAGHSGQARHVDAEAVLGAARGELAQEYDAAVGLGDRYVHVDDAVVCGGHLVELVVVGGKEGLGAQVAVVVDVLDDGPGDGYAVVCRCAAAQLVEEYERAGAHVVEDGGGLVHLHHECRLAQGDIV